MAAIETSVRATAALDDLYRRHVGDVYRYCYAVLGNHADAEDVTQTTFINALRALERGEEPRNPANWLLVIAHNIVRQRWRQAAVRPAEVELMHDVADTSPENDVELDGLVRALQRIPPAQREALVMRELEGRSYSEITELLGLTTSALETLLFRARRSLAEELENVVTCQSAELAMSQRLDQRLSRKESRRLDEHLAECATCAQLAQAHARQRRAFKGLALLPLPIGLALFKGAPTAAAAASLPTIGASSAGGTTGLGTATAAGGATGTGGAATGGGLAVGGSLLGGAVAKVAAVLIAGVIVTATAYEGAKLITGKRESGAATRSEEAVKGAFANEAASSGPGAESTRLTGESLGAKTTSPTAHGGHGATVEDTAGAPAGSDVGDAGTPGTGGTHAGKDGKAGAPTNGSDGASGSDSPSTPPTGGPDKGTDAPPAPPANSPQGPPNPPAHPGAGGNKPATTGKPVTTRPASSPGAASHPASKPKKPKKPKKKVTPVGPQNGTPPQAANPQGPGSPDEHVPPGQAKPDEPAKPDNAPNNGADNPGLKTGQSPENSPPTEQAGNAASDATSSQGTAPAANSPATPSADTSSPSPPVDSSSEKLHGYDKPKK